MAEMEMRLMVGVTSTWRTVRPRDSSGGLSGSEFFMAFPSCSQHTHTHRYVDVANTHTQICWYKPEPERAWDGTVLPREAGRKAPAGPCRECPPELLGPSPTLHCIYTSKHKTLNAGMSSLKTGLSSSCLSKQERLKRRLDVWVTSFWTINSILVMPAATNEGGEEEEANIRDAEWLKILCHNVVQSGN